jgi:hypothetical protein
VATKSLALAVSLVKLLWTTTSRLRLYLFVLVVFCLVKRLIV